MNRLEEKNSQKRSRTSNCFARGCMLSSLMFLSLSAGLIALWIVQGSTLKVQTLAVMAPICGTWHTTTGPGLGGYSGEFRAVTASAPDDAWAVGSQQHTTPPIPVGEDDNIVFPLGASKLLISHWDGVRWSAVSPPDPNGLYNSVEAMATVSK